MTRKIGSFLVANIRDPAFRHAIPLDPTRRALHLWHRPSPLARQSPGCSQLGLEFVFRAVSDGIEDSHVIRLVCQIYTMAAE
jgi:hypothetical protein